MTIPRITIPITWLELLALFRRLLLPFSYKNGEIQQLFEAQFAKRYNYPPAVVFCKARMGLYHILKAMPDKSGGDVLISALHISDFVNIIHLAGFNPVIVDLEEHSYQIDFNDLEKKITTSTVLMLITHLSGYATDMDRVQSISKKHNVPFVEDCSQTYFTRYKDMPLGTFGMAAIFSMGLLKSVCTLNGGMVISNDQMLLKLLRQQQQQLSPPSRLSLLLETIKNIIVKSAVHPIIFPLATFPFLKLLAHGNDWFSRYQKTNKTVIWRKELPPLFFTSFSWQQAILGLSKLEQLNNIEERRKFLGDTLYERLGSDEIIKLPKRTPGGEDTFWLFPVITENTLELKQHLAQHGVDSSLMLLNVLSDEESFAHLGFNCPHAHDTHASTLFIPVYYGLDTNHLESIVAGIQSYRDVKKRNISNE
jgi:dTDP-4-amino-4,6-dideoxygalactose transaminase